MSRRRLPAGAKVSSLTGLSLRTLRARPLRSLLTTGAVVLGVGMVFGVLLLTGTIHSTFNKLFDSIYGKTDVVVSGQSSIGSLPEPTIDRVRAVPGVMVASGDVGSVFRTVDSSGKASRSQADQVFMAGVDFMQPNTTEAKVVEGRDPIAGQGEVELDKDWADQHDLGLGDPIRFSTPTGLVTLHVAGLFEFPGGLNLGGYGTGTMPVSDARRVMDKPSVWDEISVIADGGISTETLRRRIDAALGPGIEVATPQTKSSEASDQLASLDVVLYFFGGIALFVGGFLILNSFNMTVLQRIREIGTLRALGASDRRVARGIVVEAALLGIAGSILGLGLGAGLAVLLVKAMQGFGYPVSTVDYSWPAAIVAVVAGMVATLAGAARPAFRGARIPPIRALLGTGTERKPLSGRRAVAGLALFVPATVIAGLCWFGPDSDKPLVGALGALATMVMFVGMVLLAPFVVLPLVRGMAAPLRRVMPAEGRLAADAAQSSPGRTSATAATLLVALSVVVVNATVAQSFVGTMRSELDKQFARDLTVQPIGYQDFGPPQAVISDQLRNQIAAMPEAGAVASRRALYVTHLPGGGWNGLMVGYDPREYGQVEKPSYEGAPVQSVLAGMQAGGVVVAKAYADSKGIHVGDSLHLEGPAGVRDAKVVGIDNTVRGPVPVIDISLGTMAGVYGMRSDSQLIVKASSPAARGPLADKVNALLARRYPGLEALSNAQIKKQTTDAINQQFGFFNAIVAIAVLVGMLGIINTLTMSVLERTREIGVLRALGASRWRVRRTLADESLLISLAGSLAGMAAGLLVGVLWVLGMKWTTFAGMTVHLPVTMLVAIAVLGVVIGVIASVLPARRAAKLDPLTALHYE